MTMIECFTQKLGISKDSPEWSSALRLAQSSYPKYNIEQLDCIDGFSCEIVQKGLAGSSMMDKRECAVFCTEKGILFLCPSTGNLPYAVLIKSKEIRVVNSEKSFRRATININTNDYVMTIIVPKSDGKALEKSIDKVYQRAMR